jgi:hypothetical protein
LLRFSQKILSEVIFIAGGASTTYEGSIRTAARHRSNQFTYAKEHVVMINDDRLSQWLAGALLAWTVCCLFLFVPIFHLLLGFPTAKVIISAAIGCTMQLAFTPWLFSARATASNPNGITGRRSIAVIVWLTSTALVFFYYIQRSWPMNSDAKVFRICLFGTTIALGILALVIVGIVSNRRVT